MRRRAWTNRPRLVDARRGRFVHVHGPRPPVPKNGYLIEILSPYNGETLRTLLPEVTLIPTSILDDPVDVQVEWRTTQPGYNSDTYQWVPAPTHVSEHLAAPSGEPLVIVPPNPLTYVVWYYRVRAGSVASDLWTSWTPSQRHLSLAPMIGSVAGYLDMNVGVILEWSNATAYLDMNVGVAEQDPVDSVVVVSDMNVGVDIEWVQTSSYADLNVAPVLGAYQSSRYADMNVAAGKPTPHLWWIRPEQGREGYVFHLFGHGFGAFQAEWDGRVRLGNLICPVIRWLVVPATFTSPEDQIISHGSGLELDQITVEYGWITVLVPVGAVSAMVKVVLEG